MNTICKIGIPHLLVSYVSTITTVSVVSFFLIVMSKLEANKQDVVVDVKSKGEDKPVQDYRLTKKSAWGMFYVGLASIFGRFD